MHFYSPAFLFSGKERSCWYTIKEICDLSAIFVTMLDADNNKVVYLCILVRIENT